METTDLALSDVLLTVQTMLDDVAGRTLGRQIIDAKTEPNAKIAETYSLDMRTSTNRKAYRDRGRLRLRHDLVVAFVARVKMNDQHASYLDALDDEQRFVEAAGLQATYQPIRMEYVSTSRTILPAREYILIQLTFALEHDLGRLAT